MWQSVGIICVLLVVSSVGYREWDRETMLGAKYYDGKKIEIPFDEDHSLQLFNHWIQQAVGGMLSAYTTNKIKSNKYLNDRFKNHFDKCAKKATDVTKHARCVISVLEAEKSTENRNVRFHSMPVNPEQQLLRYPTGSQRNRFRATQIHVESEPSGSSVNSIRNSNSVDHLQQHYQMDEDQANSWLTQSSGDRMRKSGRTEDTVADGDEGWVGDFRLSRDKRSVVNRKQYKILTENSGRTPWGLAARIMKKALKTIKKKSESKPWHAILAEIKGLSNKLKADDAKKRATKRRIKELANAQEQNEAIDELRRYAGPVEVDIQDYNGIPLEIEDTLRSTLMDGRKKMFGAPIKLMRESIKLAMMIAGKNVTGYDNKTLRFASPKFFAMVPDENRDNEVQILSPSVLSLQEDGNDVEKMLSVPSFLRAVKAVKDGDYQDLIDFVLDAAGVSDALESAKEEIMKQNETVNTARGIDEQPLYFTEQNATENYGDVEKRKLEVFKSLYGNLTKEQHLDVNHTGFAPLTRVQLELLYGKNSPYHSQETLNRLLKIVGDENLLHEMLVRDIQKLGTASAFKMPKGSLSKATGSRSRRAITLSPILLSPIILGPDVLSQAIVLSPVVLSPVILSPAVLGPFVLSPWVFIPVILSPRVLSPLVISPFVGSPIILSPLVLHPLILSPGVLNPFVLSPLVLTPIILSPLGLSPFTLSPLVLSPLILTPTVLTPLLLSPLVLSPLVLSPQFLFALILSPYFMSPLVASNLTLSAVILSPSILS